MNVVKRMVLKVLHTWECFKMPLSFYPFSPCRGCAIA